MKQRRTKSPRVMKDMVRDFVKEAGLSPKSMLHRVRVAWPEAAGKEMAGHTSVRSLRRNVLSVSVDSAPHFYELVTFREKEIRKALNDTLRPSVIQKINFHISEVK